MTAATCDCTAVPHAETCPERREQERCTASARRVKAILEARALGLARWRGAADAISWYVSERMRRISPPGLRAEPSAGGGYDPHRAAIVERQYAAVVAAIQAAEVDDRERYSDRRAPLVEWMAVHFVRDRDRRPIGRTCGWLAEWGTRMGWGGWTEREVAGRLHRACRVVRERLAAGGWLSGNGT